MDSPLSFAVDFDRAYSETKKRRFRDGGWGDSGEGVDDWDKETETVLRLPSQTVKQMQSQQY